MSWRAGAVGSRRCDALRAIGLPPDLRTAYASYRHSGQMIAELRRRDQLGAAVRDAEAKRRSARTELERGLLTAGFSTQPAHDRGTNRVILEALLLADGGDVTGATGSAPSSIRGTNTRRTRR